jgi:hypothetical protein
VVERQHHHGEVVHLAQRDKTYFAVELFCLISRSGLAYGLDIALAPYIAAVLSTAGGCDAW